MKIALGIDPDVKDLALGVWDDDGPWGAEVIHLVGKSKIGEQSQVRMAHALSRKENTIAMPHIIAIEGQQVDGRRARPRDLFTLAHVTGAAIHWCAGLFPFAHIIVPTPTEWKGGVAKHAHQARLYDDLGWGYEIIGSGNGRYARPDLPPSTFDHITPGQWKHVGDALLLARWAHQQQDHDQKTKQARGKEAHRQDTTRRDAVTRPRRPRK